MTNLETLLLAMLGNKGGGGEGRTTNYNELDNRPQVNGITLTGNKDSEDLNLVDINMIGVSYGVAALDGEGKVPESQLPPYPNYDTEIQNINEALDQKVDETELLSSVVASSNASASNSKTLDFQGTGKAVEKLVIEGKTSQDETPSPSAPVEVKGVGDKVENLVDLQDIVAGRYTGPDPYNISSPEYTQNLSITDNGVIFTSHSWYGVSNQEFIPVDTANNKYYLSFKSSAATWTTKLILYCFDGSKTLVDRLEIQGYDNYEIPMTSDYKYIRYSMVYTSGTKATITVKDFMITTKPVDKYITHGIHYKIPISVAGKSTNIYLNAPILNGYNINTAKPEQGCGVAVFTDGSKWTKQATNTFAFDGILNGDVLNTDTSLFACTHFKCVNGTSELGIRFKQSVGSTTVYVVDPSGVFKNDIATFSAFIDTQAQNGTPVTWYYPLATKEPFDGVEISTVVGKNALTVGTDVTPSKVEVTSFGEYYSKAQIDKMFAETISYGNIISTGSVWNGGWLDSSSYINVYYKPYTKQVIVDMHLKPSKTWNASTIGTEAKSLFFLPSDVPIPTAAIRCDVITSGYTVLLQKNNVNSVGAFLLLSGELDNTKDIYGRLEYAVI